jgi:hypothetical protein
MPGTPGNYLSTLNYATSCRTLTLHISGQHHAANEPQETLPNAPGVVLVRLHVLVGRPMLA